MKYARATRWRLLLLMLPASLVATLPASGQAVPPHVPGRLLVQFRNEATADQVRNLLGAAGALDRGEIQHTGVHVLQLPAHASEVAIGHAFAQRPEVKFAELDAILPPAGVTPNDSYYVSEWRLPKIGCPTAWSTTTGSSSVVIAILDSGCDPTHPDLSPKYVPGFDAYDNVAGNTTDVSGHGTMVAGAAAASTNNKIGVSAVSLGSMIMPVRITDASGNASVSAIASGLTWAANHGARVANISYDQVSLFATITTAAQYFDSFGGIVTTSAGNDTSALTYADNPYELTISATDQNDNFCTWSNYGTPIDLAAPGASIYSTYNGGGYCVCTGTSFSAPIVAGVAALMISANPALTGQQLRTFLEQ